MTANLRRQTGRQKPSCPARRSPFQTRSATAGYRHRANHERRGTRDGSSCYTGGVINLRIPHDSSRHAWRAPAIASNPRRFLPAGSPPLSKVHSILPESRTVRPSPPTMVGTSRSTVSEAETPADVRAQSPAAAASRAPRRGPSRMIRHRATSSRARCSDPGSTRSTAAASRPRFPAAAPRHPTTGPLRRRVLRRPADPRTLRDSRRSRVDPRAPDTATAPRMPARAPGRSLAERCAGLPLTESTMLRPHVSPARRSTSID